MLCSSVGANSGQPAKGCNGVASRLSAFAVAFRESRRCRSGKVGAASCLLANGVPSELQTFKTIGRS